MFLLAGLICPSFILAWLLPWRPADLTAPQQKGTAPRGFAQSGEEPAEAPAASSVPWTNRWRVADAVAHGTTRGTSSSSRAAPAVHAACTSRPHRYCPVLPTAVRRSRSRCTPSQDPPHDQSHR